MKLFDRPFFRSPSGKAFLVLQAWPAFFLLLAVMAWFRDTTLSPWTPVKFAAGFEVTIYLIMLAHYRVDQWNDARDE